MKTILVSTTLLMSIAALSAFGESMEGFVGDAHCGAKSPGMGEACALKCVKDGSDPVFVVGDKVYKIADPKSVDGHVGHKVTIDGDIKGDTVTVNSVKM